MPQLQAYHRPQSVEEALELLARGGGNAAVLAGGTQLNAHLPPHVTEVIDLQAVGLDKISHGPGRLTLGAMVTLQAVVDDEEAPDLVREMAHRAGPNTFRNAGTVGGTVAGADSESEFLAALLVYDAEVTVETADGSHTMPLQAFLRDVSGNLRQGIITGVALETEGATAHARLARTPADAPIVAAVARRAGQEIRLTLCGVAPTPVLVEPEGLENLNPPADFRGSTEYRQAMARTLADRVLAEI